MIERRAHPRKRSFLQGRIFYDHGRSSIDCLVRDLTGFGARLKFSNAMAMPDAFDLHIPNHDQIYRARVEWRSDDEAGVSFIGAAAEANEAAGAADLATRVRVLETELAALRRVVQRLRAELGQTSIVAE
ncbi:MAG: PilZ domain-containing protein [Proteobacteria bacterium]|nr:PilZ domain-containing protein [Pseudomonadota bacterium]